MVRSVSPSKNSSSLRSITSSSRSRSPADKGRQKNCKRISSSYNQGSKRDYRYNQKKTFTKISKKAVQEVIRNIKILEENIEVKALFKNQIAKIMNILDI